MADSVKICEKMVVTWCSLKYQKSKLLKKLNILNIMNIMNIMNIRTATLLPILMLFAACARSFPDGGLLDLFLLDPGATSAAPQGSTPYSVNLSVSSIFTTEAGTVQSFTAVLTSAPTADVLIPVSSSLATEGTVSPDNITYYPPTPGSFNLTFTPANWSVPQTVFVKGVPDGVPDPSPPYTIYNIVLGAITSTDPNYNGFNPTDLLALNYDIDSGSTPGVTVVPTAGLVTTESGGTDRFAVVLNSQPATNVILDLASSDTTEATVSPASLTFTTANWSTPQVVTVTGKDELLIQVQDGNQAVTITPSVNATSDAAYLAVVPATVAVTNVDNDLAGITVGTSTLFTSENAGSVQTFQVVLNTQPTAGASVSFNITTSDTTEAQVSLDNIAYGASAAVLIPNGNWNVPVTIYVKGIDDFTVDGDIAFNLNFSAVTSTDGNYSAIALPPVAGKNFDNDGGGMPGVTVTPNAGLITTEAGATALFAVVLDAQPTANVIIDLASSNTAEATVSPASLTFTTANWSTPQVVTVTGVNEPLIPVQDGNVVVTITPSVNAASAPAYLAIVPATVSVTNIDNDTAGITVGATSVFTSENAGSVQSFQIRLNTQPAAGASVSFNITSSDTTEAQVSLDNIAYGANVAILIPNASWNVPVTVYVKGIDDVTVDGDIAFNLNFSAVASADANYSAIGILPAISGKNFDNDGGGAPGITVTPSTGLVTTEAGGTAQFAIVLESQPSANVVIPISSSTPAEGTPSVASLTFTSANWSTPQVVTVTGADDSLVDGNVIYSIVTGADLTTADPNYNGLNPVDVSATNLDNDGSAGIYVNAVPGLSFSEAAGSVSFKVVLQSKPNTNVTIPVYIQTGFETYSQISVDGGTIWNSSTLGVPSVLTFTAANWSTPQTVMVRGINDAVVNVNRTFNIVIDPAGGDAAYVGINANDIQVTSVDDEVAGITVGAISGNTSEAGTTVQFNVQLSSDPGAGNTVTVPFQSGDTTEGTVSPASLPFTGGTCPGVGNWCTAQPVNVTGADDLIQDGNVSYSILTLPATSGNALYNGFNAADVTGILNSDNDAADVSIFDPAPLGLTISESGQTDYIRIRLNTPPNPGATVRIPVTITAAHQEISLDNTTWFSTLNVDFTEANWFVEQTVFIKSLQDTTMDRLAGAGQPAFTLSLGPLTVPVGVDTGYNGMVVAASPINGTNIEDEKYIYVTSATHDGDFDNDLALNGGTYGAVNGDGWGIPEADNFCMVALNGYPGAGNYKTLITDGFIRVGTQIGGLGQNNWVFKPNSTYYRKSDGALIMTTNAQALYTFGALTNAFDTAASQTWTGMINTSWQPSNLSCIFWTNNTPANSGPYGTANSTTGTSIRTGTIACNSALSLICVEQ
jgi:hypothetical protein